MVIYIAYCEIMGWPIGYRVNGKFKRLRALEGYYDTE